MGERRSFAQMATMKDAPLGSSDWVTVDQDMINGFAESTGDKQWIHVDVERAKKESPFGAPVAHGYLTLSLLAPLTMNLDIAPHGTVAAVNYGLDKVRFITPVTVGSKVRLHVQLVSFEDKGNGQYLMTTDNTMEVEGADKPAVAARTLAMLVAGPKAVT
ncbi:MaoC family dehydratase [Pseudahrensia aquimaris]|uniref:MaoC family dehydratase n=1 Tax=Pseudahrensia aquimaris TaxID=744461 RepID=A0ABW3FK60_9HYPH